MSDLNVFQRINQVRKAIGYITKDKSVSAGAAGSYRAVTHDAVTGMVRAHLIEAGIVIVPTLMSGVFHAKETNDKGEQAKQRLYDAVYQVEFINIDKPDDKVAMQVSAHALDNGDKAPGKAMSYATKYAILKLFNIETGEDEESRYQTEDFDVAPHVSAIHDCATINELKTVFQSAYKEATASGDKNAMKELMSAKDARKRAIETENAK